MAREIKQETTAPVLVDPAPHTVEPTTHTTYKKPLLMIGSALLIGLVFGMSGYYLGAHSRTATTARTPQTRFSQNDMGFRGGEGMGRIGNVGEVTAISDTSITITGANDNITSTYTINSATIIRINGATGKVSDIKTGDQVVVSPDASDAKIAGSIRVGMGGPGMQQSQTDTSTDTTRTN